MPIEILAAADEATLYVYGGIGVPDNAGYLVDPSEFVFAVEAQTAPKMTVRLATVGGDPVAAGAMFQALVDHPAKVTTVVDSKAYSAGSMILQGGDVREARPLAMVMVHGPRFGPCQAGGTAGQMRDQADILDAHAAMMIGAYTRHGIAEDVVRGWVSANKDVYFSASEAKAVRLIDKITESESMTASAPEGYRIAAMGDNSINAAPAALKEATMADDKAPGGKNQPDNTPANVVAAYDGAQRAGQTEGTANENKRVQSILAMKGKRIYSHAPIQAVLDACIADTTCNANTAQERAIQALELLPENAPLAAATATVSPVMHGGVTNSAIVQIGHGGDQADKVRAGMSQAIMARAGVEKQDMGNQWRGHSLVDLARDCLASAGVNVYGMSAHQIAHTVLAAQTTSDYPVMLENTMHKMVMSGFEAQAGAWRQFTKMGSVSDLRDWKRITPGLLSDLTTQDEDGVYRTKPVPDGEAESIAAELIGNIIRITANVLINDDLNYIETRARGAGGAAERTVNRKVFQLLAANPLMQDGNALFSTAHGNLAGSGTGTVSDVVAGPPDLDTVDGMGAAMAEQTAPTAKDDPNPSTQYLDLNPYAAVAHRRYLSTLRVINGSTIMTGRQIGADPGSSQAFAGMIGDKNPMEGTFSQIAVSVLAESLPWYVFADPNIAPVIEVVFLNGQQAPQVKMEQDFDSSGVKYKIEYPHGVGAIGWRGAVKNPGE